MKSKLFFILGICIYSFQPIAEPFGNCPPYTALYGDNILYDLNHRPILALLDNDLKMSNLLGSIPSFDLFKTTQNNVFYPNGDILVSFQSNGTPMSGTQNIFYENGNLMASIPYEKGQKNGSLKLYYANGVLMANIPYQNDMINGQLITYYANNNMQMRQTYENNVPVGRGEMYHDNGNLQLTQSYQNGKIQGLQTQFYEDGSTVQSEIFFSNGVMNQTARLFYFDSAPLAVLELNNGEIISNVCYTNVGQEAKLNKIEIYKFLNGMRPINCFYQSEM